MSLRQAVVIGGSAGSLDALSRILPLLPANFPLPILVVVHVPADKESVLPELFRERCALEVGEAEDKEPIRGGKIYFAPPDYHLLVESGHYLSLSADEPQLFSRPSIDVLFESAADAYRNGLVGIILTGANNDGAAGLRRVADAGGLAIVQAPENAYATAMPEAAIARCPEAVILEPDEIARALTKEADL